MGEIIDKVKDKAKDVKDAVVDTTKGAGEKTKDTLTPSHHHHHHHHILTHHRPIKMGDMKRVAQVPKQGEKMTP